MDIERIAKPDRVKDLTGQKFGSWTVISYYGRKTYGSSRSYAQYWNVRCDCGEERVVQQTSLLGGISTKCRRCSHGEPGGPGHELYQAWATMKSRCHNPRHYDFYLYGARGIEVCPRWRGSFQAFLMDVGARPPGYTLDRIDNSKGYEPGNVRWATRSQQMQNRRPWGTAGEPRPRKKRRALLVFGESLPVLEACRRYNIAVKTFYDRQRRGLTAEQALTRPRGKQPKTAA